MNKKPEMKHCSFCDKSETEVKSLIIGPDSGSSSSSISICDECAKLCYEITIAAKSKRQLAEAREETEIYTLARYRLGDPWNFFDMGFVATG